MNWWEWLLSSTPQLKSMGVDPKDRVRHCGHRHALSDRWARSIGMWGGGSTAKEIMSVVGVGRSAYENFKFRHSLLTCGREEPSPEHEVSAMAFVAVNSLLVGVVTPGEAAQGASKIVKVNPAANPGMLPIELLLRWTRMKMALETENLTVPLWDQLSPATQEVVYVRTELDIRLPLQVLNALG